MGAFGILIIARDEDLSTKLVGALSEVGGRADVARDAKIINEKTSHLVVLNTDGAYDDDKTLLKNISKYKPKTVIVNDASGMGLDIDEPVKQIYVDNVLPGCAESLAAVFTNSKDQHVFVPREAWVSVVTDDQLVKQILSELFSFSEARKTLLGKLFSFREIASAVNPAGVISVDANAMSRLPRKDVAVQEVELSIPFVVSFFEKLPEPKKNITRSFKVPKMPRVSLPKLDIKKYRSALLFIGMQLVALVALPYLLLAIAASASGLAYNFFRNGNMQMTKGALSVSTVASGASKRMSYLLSSVPLIGEVVGSSGVPAGVLNRGTRAAGRVLAITDYAQVFSGNVFESGEDMEDLSAKLHLELDLLYRDLSFLDSEAKAGSMPFSNIIPFETIGEYRNYVLTASTLAENLPSLLGYDKPKTYLLLLQNNMELRPTGGFIGSFALLTFSKGELTGNTVYDVYSADGQLKGYVEPPQPIALHLGEASWTLRDSNWDPNFSVSARRAEWFLDKSLDRQVDGVVAINLEAARKYLDALGPLRLVDFDDTIDSKNLYEKVQFEVENSFFPGSRKKAQYLSSLASTLIGRMEASSGGEAMALITSTISSLNSRDIQVYMHDQPLNKAFSDQRWAGELGISNCSWENCHDVFAGLVEANVGVNKANYFIEREVRTKVSTKEYGLGVSVLLKLKNNAGGSRVPEERYKAYVRAIAEPGATSPKVYVDGPEGVKYPDLDIEKYDDRVEYGAIVDVQPGSTEMISFEWEVPGKLDFTKSGKLGFRWWKQSGVGEYPMDVYFDLPGLGSFQSSPPLSLTDEGSFLYNTTLAQDLMIGLEWKDKK